MWQFFFPFPVAVITCKECFYQINLPQYKFLHLLAITIFGEMFCADYSFPVVMQVRIQNLCKEGGEARFCRQRVAESRWQQKFGPQN